MRVGRGALARPRVGGGREEVRGNGGPGFGGSRVPPVACRLPCTAGAARYRGACWFRGRARGRVRRAVRFPQSSARRGPSWSWGGREGGVRGGPGGGRARGAAARCVSHGRGGGGARRARGGEGGGGGGPTGRGGVFGGRGVAGVPQGPVPPSSCCFLALRAEP